MRTELIKAPFSESLGLLQAEWKKIFAGMLKIESAGVMLALLGAAAFAGLFVLLQGFGILPALAIAALVSVPVFIGSAITRLLSYNFVDSVWSKKRISLMEKFGEIALPALGYMIVRALITLVIVGPIFALMFVVVIGSMVSDSAYILGILLNLVFRIAIWVALAAIALFLQFAPFELLVAGNGVLDSFGKSYSIVKRNFYETVIFSFILAVAAGIVGTPFILLLFIVVIVGLLGGIALSGAAGIAIIALTILVSLVIVLAMQAAVSTATITTQYKYWSRARLAR